ncbi:MAG: DMT family transporter [Oscillospiraceae bacterium]|jgi:drug/metabolite transporter (DMT)-like permease
MKSKKLYGNILLLITAFIWGSAFVAQSVGMNYIGPFTFNAVRSIIGGLVLLPVIVLVDAMRKKDGTYHKATPEERRALRIGGICCGIIFSVASCLQQIGINEGTSSGKAGFITAFYILLVPIMGLFLKKRVRPLIWGCVALALTGLYLLCVTDNSVSRGDLYVLLCAFCYAIHILIIDYFSPKVDCVRLSCIQFWVAGILSGICMLLFETPVLSDILAAWAPILYAGVMSCGVAYTLQIIGQKYTDPTIASMLMSFESVFAVLAGILILQQLPSASEWIGCVLMFAAIIIAQLPEKRTALKK